MARSLSPISMKGGLRAPKSALGGRRMSGRGGIATFGGVRRVNTQKGRGNPGNPAGRVRTGRYSGAITRRVSRGAGGVQGRRMSGGSRGQTGW